MPTKNKELIKLFKKFPIGTLVIVSEKMLDMRGHGEHLWSAVPCRPFSSWVCGATYVCNGTVVHGRGGYCGFEGEYDYEPGYLTNVTKIPVLLVREYMFGRAVRVPVTGVKVAIGENYKEFADGSGYTFPEKERTNVEKLCKSPMFSMRVTEPSIDDEYRKELSKYAAEQPRDEKGRFKKTNA
jgi:hypothetical protein